MSHCLSIADPRSEETQHPPSVCFLHLRQQANRTTVRHAEIDAGYPWLIAMLRSVLWQGTAAGWRSTRRVVRGAGRGQPAGWSRRRWHMRSMRLVSMLLCWASTSTVAARNKVHACHHSSWNTGFMTASTCRSNRGHQPSGCCSYPCARACQLVRPTLPAGVTGVVHHHARPSRLLAVQFVLIRSRWG